MTEQELIAAIRKGEELGYRQLYDAYADRVYNTALSILQHTQDAEDITQEVFVEVFRSVQTFRGDASLLTWMYKITTGKCADHLKRSKAKKRFAFVSSLFGEDASLLHDKPHFEHPGLLLEHKEHGKMLFNTLKRLPEKQQIAFTLHKIEGLSHAEIADVMNLSTGAVESLLFRANEKLKILLSDYYKNNIQSGAGILSAFLL